MQCVILTTSTGNYNLTNEWSLIVNEVIQIAPASYSHSCWVEMTFHSPGLQVCLPHLGGQEVQEDPVYNRVTDTC